MKKNVAGQVIGCQMINSTTGAAFTGAVSVFVTGDAGTQAAGSVAAGACVHEGNGFHTYAPAQAETNFDHIGFTFIGTGALPTTLQVYTGHPASGDAFARLGAPAGASHAADIAAVKVETAAILEDSGTTLPATLATLATASALATVDNVVDNIQVRTDLIPAAPAAVGDIPTAATVAGAVRTNLATELARIDANVSAAGISAAGVRTAVGLTAANLDTQLATVATGANLAIVAGYLDTEIAAIKAKTDMLPASPAATGDIPTAATVAAAVRTNLTVELGRIDAAISSVAGLSAAGVRTALGLAAANLDTQLATLATATSLATVASYVDTEIAAIKGVTDKLDTTLEADGGVFRFTENSLELAPVGTGSGGGGLDATGVRNALGLATANLDVQLAAIKTDTADIPTNAEFAARTLPTANYATAAALTGVAGQATAIEADTQDIQSRLPAALVAGRMPANVGAVDAGAVTAIQAGLATAAALGTVASYIDTEVAAIKARTDNLPNTPAAASDIPTAATVAGAVRTNLATELARIDVAVSSVSGGGGGGGLDAAGVRAAIGLAAANLDDQLNNLPTNAELAASFATADDATLAALSAVPGMTATAVRSNLATELARIDVAVSTTSGLNAAGVRSALGLAAATLDTQLAGVSGILDRFDTMIQLDGAVYRFTVNALEMAPAGGGGGGGASVEAFLTANNLGTYDVDSVGGALFRLVEAPGVGPVDPVPAAPAESGVCRVYGFLETPDNAPAAGVNISFTLVTTGLTAGDRIISGRKVTVTTNRKGEVAGPEGNWIDLQRNDIIVNETATETYWLVTCSAIGVTERRIDLIAPTADLRALLMP